MSQRPVIKLHDALREAERRLGTRKGVSSHCMRVLKWCGVKIHCPFAIVSAAYVHPQQVLACRGMGNITMQVMVLGITLGTAARGGVLPEHWEGEMHNRRWKPRKVAKDD